MSASPSTLRYDQVTVEEAHVVALKIRVTRMGSLAEALDTPRAWAGWQLTASGASGAPCVVVGSRLPLPVDE